MNWGGGSTLHMIERKKEKAKTPSRRKLFMSRKQYLYLGRGKNSLGEQKNWGGSLRGEGFSG